MSRRSAREGGFTIVEAVVAVFVLVMGALATFGLLSSATKNTERAKASQVALEQAEQEMERLRGLTNEERALTDLPPYSSDPLNPDYRVSGPNFALTREPPGDYHRMVVNGDSLYGGGKVEGGTVSPGPTPFTSGDVSGEIYRYVVWRDDERCPTEPKDLCPGPEDYKQIVVAVKLDKPGNQPGERGYVEVQSNFVDPADSAANDPIPNGSGDVVTAQQFFLSDTPCSAAANGTTVWTQRQEITEDHLLHNTLGTCASGPQTGTTLGAPDALLLGRPPDPSPEDPGNPPLYDYSDDYYLEPTPDTDKGVQIRKDDTTGCHYVPAGTTNPESQVHRWVTDPMGSDFTLTEKVTIELYTRTLNDEPYTGTLCVYLFNRHEEEEEGELTAKDTQLTTMGGTPYWEYTPEKNGLWPRFEWAWVRLTMSFKGAPYTIPAADRLGVALSVERANTPADAIPIMYDHPNYATRIEVDTSTPIEGG